MGRPHALLRAGFPYLKTIGVRRITNFPCDVAIGGGGWLYVLSRSNSVAMIRKMTLDDDDLGEIGARGTEDGQFLWPVAVIVDREEDLFVAYILVTED